MSKFDFYIILSYGEGSFIPVETYSLDFKSFVDNSKLFFKSVTSDKKLSILRDPNFNFDNFFRTALSNGDTVDSVVEAESLSDDISIINKYVSNELKSCSKAEFNLFKSIPCSDLNVELDSYGTNYSIIPFALPKREKIKVKEASMYNNIINNDKEEYEKLNLYVDSNEEKNIEKKHIK